MTDPRPDWDAYGLHLARAASYRADCTRRLVGAALFGADHRVLSLGYNGAPSGQPGCLSAGACPRGLYTHAAIPGGLGNSGHPVPCIALHAEVNCMEHFIARYPAGGWHRDLVGASLYVTDAPCVECRAYLREFLPLNRIVTPSGVYTNQEP